MLAFNSPSRALEVARYIDGLIDKRGLEAGDKIGTKDEFRENIGVARATVNEAVMLLHERGRVAMRSGPRGGVFVAQSDPSVQLGSFLLAVGTDSQSVGDAMALRDFLESMVLSEAIKHRTERDISDLRHCLEQLENFHGDTPRFVNAVWQLHQRIALITPNVTLRTTYCGLVDFIRSNVSGFNEPHRDHSADYEQERIDVHAEIVDAIEAGDLSRVDTVVKRHNDAS